MNDCFILYTRAVKWHMTVINVCSHSNCHRQNSSSMSACLCAACFVSYRFC